MRLNESMDKPIRLFHGTTTTFLPSILKHGLLPDVEHSSFGSADGLYSIGGVYLTSMIQRARLAADEATIHHGGLPMIVEVLALVKHSLPDEDDILSILYSVLSAGTPDMIYDMAIQMLKRDYVVTHKAERMLRKFVEDLDGLVHEYSHEYVYEHMPKEDFFDIVLNDDVLRDDLVGLASYLRNKPTEKGSGITNYRFDRRIGFRGPTRIVGFRVRIPDEGEVVVREWNDYAKLLRFLKDEGYLTEEVEGHK